MKICRMCNMNLQNCKCIVPITDCDCDTESVNCENENNEDTTDFITIRNMIDEIYKYFLHHEKIGAMPTLPDNLFLIVKAINEMSEDQRKISIYMIVEEMCKALRKLKVCMDHLWTEEGRNMHQKLYDDFKSVCPDVKDGYDKLF